MSTNKIVYFFPVFLSVIAIIGILYSFQVGYSNYAEIIIRWVAFTSIGLQGLWAAFGHLFKSKEVAAAIGWETNPFQYEIGAANLGLGVAGMFCLHGSISYILALVIASTIFWFGCVCIHIIDMKRAKNFTPGNAGPIVWLSVINPLIMIVSLLFLRH